MSKATQSLPIVPPTQTSKMSVCPLEELLMKKGLIANSLTEHPLMVRLRDAFAEKSFGSASLFTGIERFIRNKITKGDRYLIRSEFASLVGERIGDVMTNKDIDQLFNAFSSDKPDSLFSEEFFMALKGPMTSRRREILSLTFQNLDNDRKGYIDAETLLDSFDAARHPEVISQAKSKDAIQKDFFRNFEVSNTIEGKITREDFFNYYSKISACIPEDSHFETQLRNIWKMNKSSGPSSAFPGSHIGNAAAGVAPSPRGSLGLDPSGYPSLDRNERKIHTYPKNESKQQDWSESLNYNRRFERERGRSGSPRTYEVPIRSLEQYYPIDGPDEGERVRERERHYNPNGVSMSPREASFDNRSLGHSLGRYGPRQAQTMMDYESGSKMDDGRIASEYGPYVAGVPPMGLRSSPRRG